MRDRAAANLLRLSRVRMDLRQSDVGARADLSRASVGEHERGRIEGATLRALRRHAEALNLSLEIVLRGPTGQLAQDEEHALLTQWVKRRLESSGWETEAEASYSIYGERGRVDLLGWGPDRRAVLIDEQKTDIPDVQDLLGTLDVKERLAITIARERGWDARSVGVLLVITRTNRNVATVQRFADLFSRYAMRGAEADRWLRDPVRPARMLIFVPPKAVGQRSWRTGRRRVSRPRTAVRTADVAGTPPSSSRVPGPNATLISAGCRKAGLTLASSAQRSTQHGRRQLRRCHQRGLSQPHHSEARPPARLIACSSASRAPSEMLSAM